MDTRGPFWSKDLALGPTCVCSQPRALRVCVFTALGPTCVCSQPRALRVCSQPRGRDERTTARPGLIWANSAPTAGDEVRQAGN